MPHTSEFYMNINKEISDLLNKDISDNFKRPIKTNSDIKPEKPHVVIYTDGSWKHQVQAGGWCALLTWEDGNGNSNWKMVTESQYHTTINRMEISAVINALKMLNTSCDVLVVSDSQLTVNTINIFIKLWKKNNFISSKGKEIANRDLIDQLVELMEQHNVKATWVKAHTGLKDPMSLANDVCDYFAQKSVDKLVHSTKAQGGNQDGCNKIKFRGKKKPVKKYRNRR